MASPHSHKKEKKSEFLTRCLANTHIQNDFETQDQKSSVCYSLLKKKSKKALYAIETESDETYVYTITPEDEGENPLDHDADDPKTPQKAPDKWPTEAPNALDDTKGADRPPSLHSGGLNPNPDNSKNFPIKSGGNWENPTIDDQKWFLALKDKFLELISNKNGIQQDYMDNDPDINKLKEWYIAEIDKMPHENSDAKWPLSFDKIEKHFDRPNKSDTPENKLKDKQSEENQNTNKIAEEDKPFVI